MLADHGKEGGQHVWAILRPPRPAVAGDDRATLVEGQFEFPRIGKADVHDRGAVFVPGMDHHDHPEIRALAKEPRVLLVGEIHPLRRRMDLQKSRATLRKALQFRKGISPLRIDRDAGDHRAGIAGHDLKQVVVGDIERSLLPVGLAAVVVHGILGEDGGLVDSRSFHLFGQGHDVSLVDRRSALAEPELLGEVLQERAFGDRLGDSAAGTAVAGAEQMDVEVQGAAVCRRRHERGCPQHACRPGRAEGSGEKLPTIDAAAHESPPF